jgi:hypothetical protein
MHLADAMYHAGVIQHALGGRGFTRVDVRDNANVADLFRSSSPQLAVICLSNSGDFRDGRSPSTQISERSGNRGSPHIRWYRLFLNGSACPLAASRVRAAFPPYFAAALAEFSSSQRIARVVARAWALPPEPIGRAADAHRRLLTAGAALCSACSKISTGSLGFVFDNPAHHT